MLRKKGEKKIKTSKEREKKRPHVGNIALTISILQVHTYNTPFGARDRKQKKWKINVARLVFDVFHRVLKK